jgi:hypothetical protein
MKCCLPDVFLFRAAGQAFRYSRSSQNAVSQRRTGSSRPSLLPPATPAFWLLRAATPILAATHYIYLRKNLMTLLAGISCLFIYLENS